MYNHHDDCSSFLDHMYSYKMGFEMKFMLIFMADFNKHSHEYIKKKVHFFTKKVYDQTYIYIAKKKLYVF